MYEYDFFKFLAKWRTAGRYPDAYVWPQSLQFGRTFWDTVKTIHRLTEKDGHEYEASLFYEGDQIFTTKPHRGTESTVTANHSLQVKFIPNQAKQVYEKQIILDKNIISRETVHPDKLPKQIESGFLFNMHTHPNHFNSTGEKTYGFFSDIDINSLLGSSAYLMGLVTDEFWLVCKTDSVIKQIGEVGQEMLMRITEETFESREFLNDVVNREMKNWGLVFYRGDFSGTLHKI